MSRAQFHGGLLAAACLGALLMMPSHRANAAESDAPHERWVGRRVDGVPFCQMAEVTDTKTGRVYLVNNGGGIIEVAP